MKIMKINLGIIWFLDFKSAGLRQKELSCFMDGNCNITEILLVISYTTSYYKSTIIMVTKLLVNSYCPTLLTVTIYIYI